jgi:hypothetical protein
MRDCFDQLFSCNAVVERLLEVKWQLIGAIERDEARYRDQTAIAGREPWTLPDVAEAFSLRSSEQHFNGAAFVHRCISLRDPAERQFQIENR